MKLKNYRTTIALDAINVLPQIRITFDEEGLLDLANDIVMKGLINLPVIAKLTKAKAKEYVTLARNITHIDIVFSQLKPHEGYYYILIAGERRYRAHRRLADVIRQKKANNEISMDEYWALMKEAEMMEVSVCPNLDPIEAKSIQFRENNYIKPPLHEEAQAYVDFYKYLKKEIPDLTVLSFAKNYVGLSDERKIRRALWFTELPETIQELVRKNQIKYSHAVEMHRLMQAFKDDPTYLAKVLHENTDYLMVYPRVKLETFAERIQKVIDSKQQYSLFEVPTIGITKRRHVAGEHMLRGVNASLAYIQHVRQIALRGQLGKGRFFSERSPKKMFLKIFEVMESMVPGFKITREQRTAIQRYKGNTNEIIESSSA